jgi:hypothetical protein
MTQLIQLFKKIVQALLLNQKTYFQKNIRKITKDVSQNISLEELKMIDYLKILITLRVSILLMV